VLSTT